MHPGASGPLIGLVATMQRLCMVGAVAVLVSCGGSSSSTSTTSNTKTLNYTLGGTISGLTVSSVVLANGSSTVTVSAYATSWTFPGTFDAGTGYAVTIKTQPAGELCEVTSGGSGTNTGDVGNVTVVCNYGQWAWEGGSTLANTSAVYGTQGTASAGNLPGARYASSSWTDASDNFWLFGGIGYDSTGAKGYLNDLWRLSPNTGLWTWVSGGNVDNAIGVYGTQGSASAGNVPGGRQAASSWTDSSGNLWLFGGVGYDSTGAEGNLNDLWRYSPSSGQWTWISGGSGANENGVYGTLGTAAAGNVPSARYSANSWIDSSGNLWLFGGYGYDSSGGAGSLNDLWKYSPSSGQWTWVSGGNLANGTGVYGTEGTAAAGDVPGARYGASSWIDSSGNLWLFGGYGYDSSGSLGKLNDLWKYAPSSGEWTWVSGEDAANAIGVYGVLGIAATTNLPGARQAADSWIDSSGNLWLFGGSGYDIEGTVGNLSDLWRFSPTDGEWTWVSGSDRENTGGVYGTLGAGAPGDAPGGRNSTSYWLDTSGKLWLFGGEGYDSSGALGYLNDLWRYDPTAGT